MTDIAPTAIVYTYNPMPLTRTIQISPNQPTVTLAPGSTVTSFTSQPALPGGLTLNAQTVRTIALCARSLLSILFCCDWLQGVISGTPTVVMATATYTITAANSGGVATVNLIIT